MTTVFAHLHEITQVGRPAVSPVVPTFFVLVAVGAIMLAPSTLSGCIPRRL
jgi:hypothetical protein